MKNIFGEEIKNDYINTNAEIQLDFNSIWGKYNDGIENVSTYICKGLMGGIIPTYMFYLTKCRGFGIYYCYISESLANMLTNDFFIHNSFNMCNQDHILSEKQLIEIV
jgi:hypothetical protein